MTRMPYQYLRADGVPVAHPLFQAGGGGSIPTSALQLRFDVIDVQTARGLNALWHSVLPNLRTGQITGMSDVKHTCYVAECDGGYYATAIWTSPPAVNRMKWDVHEVLELRRMAVSDQAPKNSASRMLGWMVRDIRRRYPTVHTLISYQAEDHHVGTIYKAAGWTEGPRTKFTLWTHDRGSSTSAPTTSRKVRWERRIRGTAPLGDDQRCKAHVRLRCHVCGLGVAA